MQTRKQGPPSGPWANCGRDPEGFYGVMVGHGATQIGFIREQALDAFICAGAREEEAELMLLIIEAQKRLAKFKEKFRQQDRAGSN